MIIRFDMITASITDAFMTGSVIYGLLVPENEYYNRYVYSLLKKSLELVDKIEAAEEDTAGSVSQL